MEEPQGEQTSVERDGIEPPFKDEVTIIWKREKAELLNRLDTHAKMIEDLSQRVNTLESWAVQLKREPTAFTEIPISEHPLYKQDKRDRTAWDAPKPVQTLGAGIGQAIPNPMRGPKIPEADYEGPTEGPRDK